MEPFTHFLSNKRIEFSQRSSFSFFSKPESHFLIKTTTIENDIFFCSDEGFKGPVLTIEIMCHKT